MALKRLFFATLFVLAVFSCSKDDAPKNNAPTIADKAFTVKEDIPGGSPIGTLTAADKDGDALSFSIAKNDADLFDIAKDGKLSLATGKSLDFEAKAKHAITVSVSDGEASASATVTINVEEVPNNAPEVAEGELAVDVFENIGDTAVIAEIEATDKDGDELSFAITDGNGAGLFEIVKVEGKGHLSLVEGKTLDFDVSQSHTITVGVGDGKDTTPVTVSITVKQVNENSNNPPVAQNQTFNVPENQTVIGTVDAQDADGDDLVFTITEDEDDLFTINNTGTISLAEGKTLDFETKQSHTLAVKVDDGQANIVVTITINVEEANTEVNNPPVAENQAFDVPEDQTAVGTVEAQDADGDELAFTINEDQSGLFVIDNLGAISLAEGKALDFETQQSHTISVKVDDGQANIVVTITINVGDVDDTNKKPVFTDPKAFGAQENIADTEAIGTVMATDEDGDDLAFSITADNSQLFEITAAGVLSLVSGKALDFESAPEGGYGITVMVDDGTDQVEEQITINVTDVNEAPAFAIGIPNGVSFKEDIADTQIILQIPVVDPEGDDLTFTIIDGDTELFEIIAEGAKGVLSLAPGKNLDYETMQSHELTISVSDGELSAAENITIIINVENVADTLLEDPTSFITIWKTDNPGTSSDTQVIIPTFPEEIYNYTVYWEEVNDPSHNGTENNVDGNITIDFGSVGIYRVAIVGTFPRIFFNQENDNTKIISVERWGNNPWTSMNNAFSGCSSLTITANDAPDLSNVADMSSMFQSASKFNQDISHWDVSNVINMAGMFWQATNFNKYIGNWDVSNVTHMQSMFNSATSFNQPLNWSNKTGKVTNMQSMFFKATSFDQNISDWDVSNVQTMENMFLLASSFNQDISGWDVSSVTKMNNMFQSASVFNQDISGWDISNATSMTSMLDNSGLSPSNYGATLVGWATQEPGEGPIPTGIVLNASGLEYCSNDSEVTVARNNLLGVFNWSISSDTGVTCNDL